MTDDELKAIEARAHAATPGPWTPMIGMTTTDPRTDPVVCRVAIELQVWSRRETSRPSNDIRTADTKFIAAARTDVPALVAEVRRLREALGFYANDFNWMARTNEIGERASDVAMRSPAMQDHGRRAQTALKDFGERYGQKAYE